MLTKALVDKVISKNEIRIRIPVLDKISSADTSTKNDNLYIATICSLPNFSYNLRQNDIVYVEFEDNIIDRPVIIGLQKNSSTKVDGEVLSILVNGLSKIKNINSIGKVSFNEIGYLENLNINVQDSLNKYNEYLNESLELIENNSKILEENVTKLYDDSVSINNLNDTVNSLKNIDLSKIIDKTFSNYNLLNDKIGNISDESIVDILKSLKEKVSNLEDSFGNGYSTIPDIDFETIEYVTNYDAKKYESLYECIMYDSTCYNGTGKMDIVGVLWHDTGANNKTIKRYVQPSKKDSNYTYLLNLIGKNNNGNDWNSSYREAGVNAFIGTLNNGSVATVQTLPWDYRPWGCGSGKKGSCNNGWIQFEICEDNKKDSIYFKKIYNEAIKLTAYLCMKFNINPKGSVSRNGIIIPTILCHWDSYLLKMGSGHYDVYDWFPSFGKCKNLTMDDVRNDVASLIAQNNS